MAITTYGELQEVIADWMIRSDMTARIPRFIALAEDRFNKVIRRPEMEKTATLSTVASSGSLSLPSDFKQARSVYLAGDLKVVLEQVTPAQLADAFPSDMEGSPTQFALLAGNTFALGPVPDDAYDIVLSYYAKIPALSDSNTSNWLLSDHSDIYLAASLAEGFAFTLDAERGAYWEGKAVQKLEDLRREGLEKAYSAAPLRMRAQSAPSGHMARY